MRREPLGIEQDEMLSLQLFDQSGQRDLGGIRHTMEHRFAEESAADRNAVEPACELILLPCFYGMRVTERMQIFVARYDLVVYPGLVTSRACSNDVGEGGIDFYLKRFLRPSGGMRKVKG